MTHPLARTMLVGLLALLAMQYLAGFLFLWDIGLDPHRASPLTMLRYAYYYGAVRPVRLRLLGSWGAALALMGGIALVLLLPRRRSLHGDARFARVSEIARAGLLAPEGIILGRIGRLRGRILRLSGQQGVALAAPPRSGKGTGIVIPNALTWPGSLVCIDIKRENWTVTAGYRERAGQACFLFDPLNEAGQTARWNPFSYVAGAPERRINDIQRIAAMFYPEVAGTDPFWMASARSLFVGIALYLFETPSLPKTIGEVLRQGMASDDEGFGAHWKRVIQGRKSGRHPLSAECVRALSDLIDLAPVTASSIRKTFTSRLDLWQNPMLDAATAASDFDLRDLRRRPVSIYVAVNPDDLHRLRPVLSLFFEQAIGLQTRELPEHDPGLSYQVLMLLDEAPALGRIPILAESIAYVPGYNVRVVLVCQAPSQLREVYGDQATLTMLKSLGARIVFAPKDFEDAKAISDELGTLTVKARSRTRPLWGGGSRGRGFGGSSNLTISDQRRALLLPQEVRELGPERAILFCEGLRPILARKIRYFRDRRFTARLIPPPVTPAPAGLGLEPRVGMLRGSRQLSMEMEAGTPGATGAGLAQEASLAESRSARAPAPPPHEESGPEVMVREATPDDLERDLTLEDFAVDVSHVEVPEDRPITDEDVVRMAEQFVATLQAR